MKANAVNDVIQYVTKIQDRVERLEVAKAVAEAFKVPESTKSLGRKGSLPRALAYHSLGQNTVPNATCSIIRTDSRTIQSDSKFRCKMD